MTYESRTDDSDSIAVSKAVGEWVRWRTRGLGQPIGALRVGTGVPTGFVPEHVLVDKSDKDLIELLVRRHAAEVLPPLALPPRPPGLTPRAGYDPNEIPMPVRLRIRTSPPPSTRGHEALRAHVRGNISVSSEPDARLIALVAEHSGDKRPISLDVMGVSATLPLVPASDGSFMDPTNPFGTPAFTGRTRICAAWQLVEAFRQIKPLKSPVLVAILDGGFWLNGLTPGISPKERASDFGSSVFQVNLLDEGVSAGGASPTTCGGSYSCDWHGNSVASAATARVGNGFGSAGAGGTVALPLLLKSELSAYRIMHGVNICLDWGVDVLNMSFSIKMPEIFFPTEQWNFIFSYAAKHGLNMVAAAGNDGHSLPDDNPRPATRTPGTITVGWLDPDDKADPRSNFGDSVNIWAPGTNIPVMPDPDNPSGSMQSGTSLAAPIVSGVIAMMRAVNPSLDNELMRKMLMDTGWNVTDKMKGLDAFAAVLAAMGGKLPPDESTPNNTRETASPMRLISPGRFVPYEPGRSAAFLSGGEEDWYKFQVNEFSQMDVQLNFYPLLGVVSISLEPDDESSQALSELTTTVASDSARLQGLLAPGGYKLHLRGPLNMYELTMDLTAAPLAPDEFEANNSFDRATRFRVADGPKPGEVLAITGPHTQGSYNLNLHIPGDEDFFRIEIGPTANPLNVPVVRVERSDEPIKMVLLDSEHRVLDQLSGVHSGHLTIPTSASPFFFVKISAGVQTRYVFSLRFEVDQANLPGPNQKGVVVPTPDPGDPSSRFHGGIDRFLFVMDDARREAGNLILASVQGRAIGATIVSIEGAPVRTAVPAGDGVHSAVELKVDGLKDGTYLIEVDSAGERGHSVVPPLNIEVLPNLRFR